MEDDHEEGLGGGGEEEEGEAGWRNEDYLSLENNASSDDEYNPHNNNNSKNHRRRSNNNNLAGNYDDDDGMDMSNDDDYENEEEEDDPLPPWMDQPVDRRRTYCPPLTALHNEIVNFVRLMEPTEEETRKREELVDMIREIVHKEFGKETQVLVFGSQATGLFLPSSDIDLVVLTGAAATDHQDSTNNTAAAATKDSAAKQNNKEEKTEKEEEQEASQDDWKHPRGSPLERLANALRDAWYSELSYLEVIDNTRVPLVKFTHASTNISVDVSFDTTTGPPAAQLMRTYLDALPPLRPLTFVIKYFLAARGLNQPYTGGVGSFMLQIMLVAYLQQRERDAVVNFRRPSLNLGSLLLEFLELYGLEFNYVTTGVSVRHDGFFFPKGASSRKEVFYSPERTYLFALENPLDTTMDVGKSSFRIQMVQRAFKVAHNILLAHVAEPVLYTKSILASILPPTEEMVSRKNRKKRHQQLSQPLSAKRVSNTSVAARYGSRGDRKRQRR